MRVVITGGTGLIGMWKAFDEMERQFKRVYRELSPLLDAEHRRWLKRATRAV